MLTVTSTTDYQQILKEHGQNFVFGSDVQHSGFEPSTNREESFVHKESGFGFNLFDQQDMSPLPLSGSIRSLFGSPKEQGRLRGKLLNRPFS